MSEKETQYEYLLFKTGVIDEDTTPMLNKLGGDGFKMIDVHTYENGFLYVLIRTY